MLGTAQTSNPELDAAAFAVITCLFGQHRTSVMPFMEQIVLALDAESDRQALRRMRLLVSDLLD